MGFILNVSEDKRKVAGIAGSVKMHQILENVFEMFLHHDKGSTEKLPNA